ncbi:CENP-B protein, partial [Athelia psychrophila]
YGVDETGIQPGGGTRERVIGTKGKKVQHQQRDGNRENITVIVSICADGTSLPPAVIFKGLAFQLKWEQDNPLNAVIGHSKKGWTDGEIGIEWIKIFDQQTSEKATGRHRLLLVDGHNSHYTLGFLEYAAAHNIHILCYPAHATHVYQGLDVAVSGILKIRWTEERDKFEREAGQKVAKNTFLAIYGKAHTRALTEETIRAVFRKTGVAPVDRSVMTVAMMAPSLESSCNGNLPLQQ